MGAGSLNGSSEGKINILLKLVPYDPIFNTQSTLRTFENFPIRSQVCAEHSVFTQFELGVIGLNLILTAISGLVFDSSRVSLTFRKKGFEK